MNGTGLALTTDSFVVRPIRFPGGSIGELAVNGTVNDLAVSGARPLALTLSLVLEEGLRAADLRAEVEAIARAADAAGVQVVARRHQGRRARPRRSDVRVHDRTRRARSARAAVAGRARRPAIASSSPGAIGEHGMAVMLAREEFALEADISSDTRSLWPAVDALLEAAGAGAALHARRHPRRRGLGAQRARARIGGGGARARGRRAGRAARWPAPCELLGIDPMYVANEGKLARVRRARRPPTAALRALRAVPGCEQAAEIGEVAAEPPGMVLVDTAFGGRRVMDLLAGDPLPRIC